MAAKFQAHVPGASKLVCDVIDGGNEELQCKICADILHNPHQLSCCGRHLCEHHLSGHCVKDSLNRAEKKCCPFCKKTKRLTTKPNEDLLCQINHLKVRCPNSSHGCAWEGWLDVAVVHVAPKKTIQGDCQYHKVECKYKCDFKPLRKDLIRHQNDECKLRPFTCEHCRDFNDTFEHVTTQHYPVCAKFPVPCPNKCAHDLMPRDSVDKHRKTCPLEKILCDFHTAGCTFEDLRKDMMAHHRKCLVEHSSLLAEQNATHQTMLGNTQHKLDKMAQQQEEQARFQTCLQEEVKKQQSSFQVLLDSSVKALEKQQAAQKLSFQNLFSLQEEEHQKELALLKAKLSEVKKNASNDVSKLSGALKAEIADTRAKLAAKTKELNGIKGELSTTKAELNRLTTRHNQTVSAYNQQFEQFAAECEQLATACKQLGLKTSQLQAEIKDLREGSKPAPSEGNKPTPHSSHV